MTMKTISQLPIRTLVIVMLSAIVGMGTSSAYAASVYFLQIDGIKGESNDSRHKDWIDVNSFSWGISNSGSGGLGDGSSSGKATISPLSWKQDLDMSVPPMFVGVSSGKHYGSATLDVAKSEGAKSTGVYFAMVFDDVILTSLKISGAGDIPSVSGTLEYSKLTMTYRPQKADGSPGTPIVGGWDLKKNAANAFFGSPDVLQGLILAGPTPSAVPVPPSVWLFGSGLLGIVGIARRRAAQPSEQDQQRRRLQSPLLV
jgi:type VI protein secretion system component Hcp